MNINLSTLSVIAIAIATPDQPSWRTKAVILPKYPVF
jgi:hypothetical protein